MMTASRRGTLATGRLRAAVAALCLIAPGVLGVGFAAPAFAYVPVNGAGSTWSANAVDQWVVDVQQYGMRVNYAATGSSDGRRQFINGTQDFAASDIPFQTKPEDNSAPELPVAPYAYMPITAGGTSFIYNLSINGAQVTNLRLSGANIAKIFTGALTRWNDPALVADNPGLTLPAKTIIPVVRSDGSGSTAQFSLWMINQHADLWNAYCHRSGRAPACGETSFYPTIDGFVAQNGDLGVTSYVTAGYGDGAIGYVNYSYALNAKFPVAKMLNVAGFYTEPTADNVAVSLLKAQINNDASSPDYLTQQLGGVYSDTDPRTYPLSSYSYLILPTKVQGQFDSKKGETLGAFSYYAMCQGQQESASLGYSPMPINLVQASFDQIKKIPGVVVQNISIASCHNPTFSPDGTNLLAVQAPQPQACDKQGPMQCATGTGGAHKVSTPVGGTPPGGSGTGTGTANGTGVAASSGAPGTGGGPGSGGAGGTPTGTGTGGDAVPVQPAQCDADGSCSGGGAGGSAGGLPVTAITARVPVPSGWTGTQTLMLLAGLLTLALVLAPGLTSSYLRGRRRR